MSRLLAVTLFASWAKHCDGIRVVKKDDKTGDTELGEEAAVESSATSNCYNIAGTYDYSGRSRGVERLTQSGCRGNGEGWTFTVSGTSLTTGSGEPGSIRPGPPLRIIFPRSGYNYTRRAGSGPAPAPPPPPQGGGLSLDQFMEWMAIAPPSGGYACGYSGQWCGCSCGNNENRTCTLPPMQPGTQGGHTCGWFGRLYGCAEAHNTIVGCPRTGGSFPSPPLSGKGA